MFVWHQSKGSFWDIHFLVDPSSCEWYSGTNPVLWLCVLIILASLFLPPLPDVKESCSSDDKYCPADLARHQSQISDSALSQSRWGELMWYPYLSEFFACGSLVPPLFFSSVCLLLVIVTTHHTATILSPCDPLYHVTVVLSEASCSFGSENSVMSLLAGRGGHAIPKLVPQKGASPTAAMPSSVFFFSGWGEEGEKVVPQVRHWNSPANGCAFHLRSLHFRPLSWHFNMIHSVDPCM